MIGARLGTWVLDKELGRGGMGQVFLAHEDPAAAPGGRRAAVKVLSAALAQEPGFLQRFEREVAVLRQLDHPNIVRLYDSGCQDGHHFYAMEYVDGRSLADLLHERGRLPWPEVLDLALQVCPALKHAHDRGVVHRDLKPANLLCGPDGTVKLTDFGIAQVFDGTQLTKTGGVVGTAEYLSPEQAAGKPASKRSDLYSLGVVLYTLLTGRTPFDGTGVLDLLQKHRYGQFDPPRKRVPELPHELDQIVCQLLDKDPARRPPDAALLQRGLESIRRKLERKAETRRESNWLQKTRLVDCEGQEEGPPSEVQEGPGPATLMSQLMRQELESQNRGGPVNRLLSRPWALVPLFLLTVGLIAWAFWPPSAASLYQRVTKLVESDEPTDWDRAAELMDQLDRKHPDHPYQKDLEKFRVQIEEREAQRQAERATTRLGPVSEAQWFYMQGLRLHQQGQTEAARRVWRSVAQGFRDVKAEQAWVQLAEKRLREPELGPAPDANRVDAAAAALARARQLRDEGKAEAAEQIWQGLEALYKDDPGGQRVLDKVRQDRGR